MFGVVSLVMGGLGRKLAIAGLVVVGVVLVLFGAYRTGAKTEERKTGIQIRDRVIRNYEQRKRTDAKVNDAVVRARTGDTAEYDRLRSKWGFSQGDIGQG